MSVEEFCEALKMIFELAFGLAFFAGLAWMFILCWPVTVPVAVLYAIASFFDWRKKRKALHGK
jgi:hypothetical protein